MSLSPRKSLVAPSLSIENKSPNRVDVVEEPPCTAQPKAPRSAFMCFSDANEKDILRTAGNPNAKKKELIKLVAEAWRLLSDRERADWDEVAREDKLRFVKEKAAFQGPWNIPKRRAKKHPLAPKRPMSAFLKYSQKRRTMVKQQNPDMSNTDVSRLLGEMWRTATPSERAPYVEEEMVERGQYKEEIQSWRSSQAMEDTEKRTSHYDFPEKDKAPSSPPPKKRKEGEPRMFRPASSAIPSHGSQTGKHIDRRIFRSHIGHSVENRYPNFDQHRSVHPMYSYADVPRAMPMRTSESNVQRAHKVNNSLPAQTVTAGANMVQRSQPSHHFTQPVYRPAHLQPQQQQQQHPHQRENPYLPPLRYSGSDVSQFDLFCDPEPPFNPRQLRPSSSHYFTDNSNPFP